MSYRVRFTTHTGATGYWDGTFATHTGASMSAQTRADVTGYTYTVEEVADAPEPTSTTEQLVSLFRDLHGGQQTVPNEADGVEYVPGVKPEPGSTAAHHVEILRERVKELEEVQKAMHRDLLFALEIGQAMREAMRTGEWRAGHDRSMASNAIAGWDRFRPSLGKAPSVPEAPGDGGDSDRRRLEALERYLEGDTFREVWKMSMGRFAAGTKIEGQHFDAPTLAALADKLAEKEAKP